MVSRGTRDHNIIALLDISRAVTMNPLWMQDSNHLSRFSRFFGFLFIGFWVGCFLRSWPSCASAECAKCVSAVFSRFLRRHVRLAQLILVSNLRSPRFDRVLLRQQVMFSKK